MADDHAHGDIIIIKKKSGGGHGHHGGAWKIAFADFMTAMMAFFLVLWIINATDKETKTVIARYFNPVKLENPAKSKKGVHGSTSAPTDAKEEKAEKANGTPTKDEKSAPHEAKSNAEKEAAKAAASEANKPPAESKAQNAEAKAQAAEAQLFAAPYQTLDKIAGAPGEASPGASPDKGDADPQRMAGALSIDAFRDPFKPIGPGSPDDPAAFDADARNKTPADLEPGKTGQDEKAAPKPLPNASPAATPFEKLAAGDAAKPAPQPAGGPAEEGKAADGAKADETKEKAEAARIERDIKDKVEAALKTDKGPAIETRQTKEGLLISLTDKLDFSMFGVGSAEPKPELVRAMEAIANVVRSKPGPIVVRGYTDARPYRNGAYDNWRLSSDRAQMAYYMLTRGGAPAARFVRVEGYADRAPKDPAHPLAAVNRRLEILIEAVKP